ncbi:thiamine pyrophosphokinase [Weissella uvarum]|uniref:thiamine diphosphokinase n=1 Tax=Weissella uvarum TaxID=1479233 RepID=UPI00195FE0A0|nr:thiamine diphosphokinase [Weissella uvarum]MBM7617762.1 thiamine pyrophosphokinase [Weissella uvarum]MCM0595859.1 thiamine diphosphokinase [Weissella uvarum]
MTKTFQLLVGGPTQDLPEALVQGTLTGRWAAADRGALRLLTYGYQPELVVGDFDSMTKAEQTQVFAHAQKVVPKLDQDQTDTELLLKSLETYADVDRIDIYGATGGRLDQLFSNFWIFTQPALNQLIEKIHIIDQYNDVTFYRAGQHTIYKNPQMRYVGFMPLTRVEHLTLVDQKYPLTDWSGGPFSWSSNEFVGNENHFSFEQGIVAVIQSRN